MDYDGLGDLLGVNVGGAQAPANAVYSHDLLGELITENDTSQGAGSHNYSYAYDAVGNPMTLRSTSGLSYNADSRTSITGTTYDGNRDPSKSTTNAALTFDAEDRLAQVDTNLYRRSTVGDPDANKGLPHWDGQNTKTFIDRVGNSSGERLEGVDGHATRRQGPREAAATGPGLGRSRTPKR